MKKTLFAICALLSFFTSSHAQKFFDIYYNGSIVSSVRAADVDSMVISESNGGRMLNFYQNGEVFHQTLTSRVDSIKVVNIGDEPLVHHGIVDLGLPSGTLWATCNIGANAPEEYGDYFAWGETEGYFSGKTHFEWDTYKWCQGSYNALTKYCTDSRYGTVDNKKELDLEDDAAYVNWGPGWRMPSSSQFEELINSNYTTTTWTTLNGVYGRMITSKRNGNSIFLPAPGGRHEDSLINAGSDGSYWSRTLGMSYSSDASGLFFNPYNIIVGGDSRCFGRSVRPVRITE